MESVLYLAIAVVVISLIFDFVNGFHDSANIVAVMISTRVLSPIWALSIAASAEFLGPFLFGTSVAKTIGKDIVDPTLITAWVIIAALIGAIAWNLITWYFGIPSSSSHALMGGLVGSITVAAGWDVIKLAGIYKVFLALMISPILGFFLGFIFMKLMHKLTHRATPKFNIVLKVLQILSAVGLALSHGTNDAQKTMGIITMSLVTMGFLKTFQVPLWVMAACAACISAGIASGGWRIIKTVGRGIFKMKVVHGFTAQTVSAGVILGAALLGGPVSTTHVLSSSVMGVGAAERPTAVKWETAKNILITWVVTVPAAAAMSWLAYYIISLFVKGA
ncbi:MAG: inorganic phosphate transporter [Chloroflexi bacterium]|nr:inorganic phosphate transporter [Chloroflexota bacterium]